jgi:tetratricopeptide (TPR) repeat protein
MSLDAPARAALLRQIDEALAANDVARAVALAAAALQQGVETPKLLNLIAYGLELKADYDGALRFLARAYQIAPRDPSILNAIGACQSKAGRPEEALIAFDDAIALHPGFAPPHCGRGHALSALGDVEQARAAFVKAVALEPRYAEALGALSMLALGDRAFEQARDYADRAIAIAPLEPLAVLTLGAIALRAGNIAEAEQRARALLADPTITLLSRSSAQRLLADVLHEKGQSDEAMAAYLAANVDARKVHAANVAESGAELAADTCVRLQAYFERAPAAAWRAAPEPRRTDDVAGHAFLMSFPRSGTTLLEQVLASHPDVVALEEKPTLDPPFRSFFDNNAMLDKLAALDSESASREREAYWARVREFGVEPSGKVFIDKMPLNTVLQPLIAKLFPRARIIFALRDPRDVVLSCFRRRFRPTASVFDYTDLDRTALYYDAVMRLNALYQTKLALPTFLHKHERLISDFDAETKDLCAFLDIPWHANMRNFVETARGRDVRTPSANQVLQGLSSEGVGQWRRYEKHLQSILPTLQPWVDQYGYA